MAQDISDTANRVRYVATAAQTAFVVPFEFADNAHLEVYKNGTKLTLSTQYTLSGAGSTGGGTMTLATGAALNDDILIVRDIPKERQGDFPVSGIFDVESLNSQLDNHIMMMKDTDTRLDRRVLGLSVTDLPEDLNDLPNKTTRANKILGFDADGQPSVEVNNAHTHTISAVSGLQAALDNKAALIHTHLIADVSGLQSALNSKSDNGHTHAISAITNLQTTLDGKAASSHVHAISDVTNLQTSLDGKAATSHAHVINDVTGLQAALDSKSATGHLHDDRYYTETEVDTLLAGKAASSHSHIASSIVDFAEAVDDEVASLLVAGANVTISYNDVGNAITIASTGVTSLDGLSDVAVSSAAAGHILRHNGTEFVNVLGTDHFAPPDGFLSITSSATPVVLTATSPSLIYVTGSVAQTIRLPDVTTLTLGRTFRIINVSTATVTVQSSGANNFALTQSNTQHAEYICVLLTGTGTASWSQNFIGATGRTGSGNLVYGNSPTISGPNLTYWNTGTFTAGTNAQNQGALTADMTFITSTPNNPSGVTLPGAAAGRRLFIINRGTNPVNIYPASADQIDDLALNAPYSLPVNSAVELNAQNGVNWYSSNSIVVGPHNHTLNSLSNVSITSLTTDQFLQWNGTAWVNTSVSAGGGATTLDGLSDVAITSAASGNILRHNGTQFVNTPGTDHFAAASHTHAASEISDSTAAGRALLTGADAAAQRTSLGLGTAALEGAGFFAIATHSHAILDVTGLQTALDGKAASSHTHTIANVTGLQTALDGKAASTHSHAIADVTGLQTALDGKAASSHTHAPADITGFAEAVDDEVASLLVAGSNVTLNYNDVANTLTIAAAAGKWEFIAAARSNGGSVSLTNIPSYSQLVVLYLAGNDSNATTRSGSINLSSNNGTSYGGNRTITHAMESEVGWGSIVITNTNVTGNKTIQPVFGGGNRSPTGFSTNATESSITGVINALRFNPPLNISVALFGVP